MFFFLRILRLVYEERSKCLKYSKLLNVNFVIYFVIYSS